MSYTAITTDDWSDYNLRKMRLGSNIYDFYAAEGWEVNYLADKIVKHYPFQNAETIKHTIASVAQNTAGPCKRNLLVKDVLAELELG